MIDVVGLAREVLSESGLSFKDLSVIELDRSGAEAPGLALLVFVDGRPQPVALIKASADTQRGERLRCEFDNLRRLHAAGDAALLDGVPAPLHLGRHGDLVTLAETAVAGTRMKNFAPDTYFGSRRFLLHLEQVVGWLATFHTTFEVAGRGDDAAGAVRRYRAGFDRSAALDALLTESVERLDGAEHRSYALHGDFCTANIIVGADDAITVVDWEYPLEPGWPLADLLYFLSSTWCVPYRKGRDAIVENYRKLFFTDHALAEPIRRVTRSYVTQTGLARDVLTAASALSWVGYANRKRAELSDASAAGRTGAEHFPLVVIDDANRCPNLELLAEHRATYLLERD